MGSTTVWGLGLLAMKVWVIEGDKGIYIDIYLSFRIYGG